jgi:hypothetical protein
MIEYVYVRILFFTREYAYILFYYFDKYILFLENDMRVCMTDCILFLKKIMIIYGVLVYW